MSRKNNSTFLNYKLKPKTEGQRRFISALDRSVVCLCSGPAGTGKTHISTTYAVERLREHVEDGEDSIQRIVITRPVVDAGRSLGYLPGTMEEKIHPYLMPIYDELHCSLERNYLRSLLAEKTVEICPLAMMRGRNFHRSFIICDEAQNATAGELRMLLTRFGRHSRVCISGDPTQTDLPHSQSGAFMDVCHRLAQHDAINHVILNSNDIVRHQLIADIERLLCGSQSSYSEPLSREAC